ncbi:MAG TPA: Daple [Actinoplanes sp.]|nr:Daple [Actinoplanes sp.]
MRSLADGSARTPEPAPSPAAPQSPPAPRWSDNRARYTDLLHHFEPQSKGHGGLAVPSRLDALARPGKLNRPGTLEDDDRRGPRLDAPTPRGTLEDDDRRGLRLDAPTPTSAPPYPYEGDLDDARTRRAPVPMDRPRQAFPAPGGRRPDWLSTGESARHALEPTSPEGDSEVDQKEAAAEPIRARTSYDPSTYPRRLPYESQEPIGPTPPADRPTGYATPTAYPGLSDDAGAAPTGEPASRALPQRVPAEPDVPTVPEPPSVEPTAETPALTRIATHLRRGDVLASRDREDGFDVKAILEAVREVEGVRDASLRTTPAGAHSLRLDLSEGADPAEVSRQVARLLQDRMGLDAAMQGGPDAAAAARPRPAPDQPRTAPDRLRLTPEAPRPTSPAAAQPVNAPPVTAFVPTQPGPAARAGVTRTGSTAAPGEDLRRLPTIPAAGRASVIETGTTADAGTDNRAGTVESGPDADDGGPPRALEVNERPGPRVVIENVQVNTFGTEATVQVRLGTAGRVAAGVATGPAVDGYLLRLCAMATTRAVDELLADSDHADGPARCFVEHAACVPFGPMHVAVVVMLLSCGGWVEQLAGSAVVTGDDRHAMVRATLAAVNRRLEALLS